jgi:hypothetical protein
MLAATGVLWGHACVFAAVSTVVPLVSRAQTATAPPWLRVLEWTLMLPLSLSLALAERTLSPLEALASQGIAWPTLALPALTGSALVMLGDVLWRHRYGVAARTVLAAFLITSALSGVAAARTAADEGAAEQVFMRMTADDPAPWDEPASRSAARTLVARYPESRWASEAWRVIAIDAEQRDQPNEALEAWRSFETCFDDATASGRAVGALARARILELNGPPDVVAAHYLRALRTMERGDGTAQPWIAPESARGLARVARRSGLHATAGYWTARVHAHDQN